MNRPRKYSFRPMLVLSELRTAMTDALTDPANTGGDEALLPNIVGKIRRHGTEGARQTVVL